MDLMNEIKKYGYKELIIHILSRIIDSENLTTDMYLEREKYYEQLDFDQLKNEISLMYQKVMNCEIDFSNLKTFTEKIQMFKLQDEDNIKARLADKYMVRQWVENTIGNKYLIPLVGAWDDIHEINFEKLPNEFCIKMNHGSGMNFLVKNKREVDLHQIYKIFESWQRRPFEAFTLERHYKSIKKKVLVEEYIEEMSGGLFDYKFHCFNGKPLFIQCIGDRNLKKHTGYQNNFDLNWNKLDWIFEDYPEFPYQVAAPINLEEMVNLATKLSQGFNYVRVDLYDLGKKVLFGEMTFTPGSGLYPYMGTWNYEKDAELGEMIKL